MAVAVIDGEAVGGSGGDDGARAAVRNLPARVSSFLGRERELVEVGDALGRSRLVTLTGPPGIGKSRMAVEAARTVGDGFVDGVWLVELAAVGDDELVAGAVASVLSVAEEPGRDVAATLAARLSRRRALLVLDNCEHLVGACAQLVNALLAACPDLAVLATSREALRVTGEAVWQVPPLRAPASGEPADSSHSAVELFVERARAVQPDFRLTAYVAPQVAEICRRLDGIALAIELAAARVESLTPAEIARRLDDRFALLTKGARSDLPRHRTLQAAVDWSHELLSVPEQTLLRRLSVFAGGWCLDSAEVVCAGGDLAREEILNALDRLVSRSLVVADTANGHRARYHLLETIRAYGADRLEQAGETAGLREAHARYFRDLAERAEPQLTGPEQQAWFERLDVDRANLRSALEWSLGHAHAQWALRQAGALILFWRVRCHFSEGRRLLQAALAGANGAPPQMRAKALWGAGFMALMTGDPDVARADLEASLAIADDTADARARARALLLLGNCDQMTGDVRAAKAQLEDSATLARDTGDAWCLAHALGVAASGHVQCDEAAQARPLFEECIAVAREAQDRQGLRWGLLGLGIVVGGQGDYRTAEPLLEEALAITDELDEPLMQAGALRYLGQIALGRGDYPRARAALDGAIAKQRELAPEEFLIRPLLVRAAIARAEHDLPLARRLLDEATRLARYRGDPSTRGEVAQQVAELELAEGNYAAARRLLEQALEDTRAAKLQRLEARVLHTLGLLARVEGRQQHAAVLHNEALDLQSEIGDPSAIACSLEAIAGVCADSGRYERAAHLLGAADGLREVNGYARSPAEVAHRVRDLELIRSGLRAEQVESALQHGSSLSLEEAVLQASKGRGRRGRPAVGWSSLTPTERHVAALVAEGLTNLEIAERMFVSLGTIKTHLSHIFRKLGITRRRELAREVYDRGADAFEADR